MMRGMFNSSAVILQAISDTLQQAGTSSLPAQWTNIANQAQTWAYQEIVSVLSGRGFTAAQIAAWDRGAEFELDLSLFRALSRGHMLGAMADAPFLLKTFDRRPELLTVIYTTGGAIQDPQGTAGLPNFGDVDTSDDIFVIPPTGDGYGSPDFPGEGRGTITQF